MRTVDQTTGDDWRNRDLDASFEGKQPPLTNAEWEAEYADFCDTELFGGVNAAFDNVFKGMR